MRQNDDERKQWLQSLKEGDSVYDIQYHYGDIHAVKEYKVKKITPKGQIRLDNDVLLGENGYKYVSEGKWHGYSIEIMPNGEEVEKAILSIKARNLWHECKRRLEKINTKKLDYDVLEAISQQIAKMEVE